MYTLFFVCEVCQENVSDTWCTQSYMYVWDGTLRYKLGKLVSFGCVFSRGCFWDKVPALICFPLKLEDLLIQRLVLHVSTVTVAIGLRGLVPCFGEQVPAGGEQCLSERLCPAHVMPGLIPLLCSGLCQSLLNSWESETEQSRPLSDSFNEILLT